MVLAVLNVVALVLALIAIPVLGTAAVARYRDEQRRPRLTLTVGTVAMAGVLGVSLVALVVGVVRDVPGSGGWAYLAAVAALVVLTVGDRRFWMTAAVLFLVFAVIGLVALFGLSASYVDAESGYRFYGSRWLIDLGGLEANPSRAGWWWSAVAVAVLQFGLPLALGVTAAYQASTRAALSRTERLGLTLVTGSTLTATFGSAGMLLLGFVGGAFIGDQPFLAALGVVGALVIVVLAGPGSVDALLVGGRTLWSWVPSRAGPGAEAAQALRDIAGTGADLGSAESAGAGEIETGFVAWARGNVGRGTKAWLAVAALLAGLMTASWANVWGVRAEATRVEFEPIDVVTDVGFVAEDAFPAANGQTWIVGEDGEVALFDAPSGDVWPVPAAQGWSDAAPGTEPGSLVGLVRGEPARVVTLGPDGSPTAEPVVLEGVTVGPDASVAVGPDAVYVISGETLGRWPATGGPPALTVPLGAGAELVGASARGAWVLRHTGEGALGDYEARLHEPAGLTPISSEGLTSAVADLTVGPDGSVGTLVTGLAALLDAGGQAVAGGRAGPDVDRIVGIDAEQRTLLVAEPYGAVIRYGPNQAPVRKDFHYDTVVALIDAGNHGMWVVTTDDRGTIVDSTTVETSVVARWSGSWDT